MIDARRVLANGAVADKASRLVDAGENLIVLGEPPRYVSRGGEKLAEALRQFDLDPTGVSALDVGASTGGFTDCLLQHGAAAVVALAVGHGQLPPRIRGDHRVVVIERCNVRNLTAADVPGAPRRVVADVSVISLTKVIPALVAVAAPGADLVLLAKPQFEAGRQEVARGRGVITDQAVHERVRETIELALEQAGCRVRAWCDSPITGADGNHEFLVHAITSDLRPDR